MPVAHDAWSVSLQPPFPPTSSHARRWGPKKSLLQQYYCRKGRMGMFLTLQVRSTQREACASRACFNASNAAGCAEAHVQPMHFAWTIRLNGLNGKSAQGTREVRSELASRDSALCCSAPMYFTCKDYTAVQKSHLGFLGSEKLESFCGLSTRRSSAMKHTSGQIPSIAGVV